MSKSDFIKKTMNDHQFAKKHATIVSASPFRAVIRRKDNELSLLEFRDDNVPNNDNYSYEEEEVD